MFGFKKKKKPADTAASFAGQVSVIPSDFYGGRDPVIHFTDGPEGRSGLALQSNRREPGKSLAARLSNKKTMLVGTGVLFVVFLIGTAIWFYVDAVRNARPTVRVSTLPKAAPPQRSTTAPAAPLPKSETEATATNAVPDIAPPLESPTSSTALPVFPALGTIPIVNTIDTGDLDNDELTDAEEELLTIDPGLSDTDGDGYYDGLEVLNLYNPNGLAPVKIIDSGLVREYVNPRWRYRIYYPAAWQLGEVDAEANQIIISGAEGDFIEVRVFPKESDALFSDWFVGAVPGEPFSDYEPVANRFGIEGFVRLDYLAAFYPADTAVFALLYHQAQPGAVSFRRVMAMTVQSFRPASISAELPAQTALPPEGAATTTTAEF